MTTATFYRSCIFMMTMLICISSTFAQENDKGFNIGLVYPLSIQGMDASNRTNIFSVHAILGLSKAEHGFTASGFGNIVREEASGFQAAGFMNIIGGPADGFKAAGFMNLYRNAHGFQAAGFSNLAGGNVNGMQAAGFMNLAHNFTGFQAAGFFNGADNVIGTQAAGFINLAEDVKGNQLAGFINVANKVSGVQIAGFINVADSSEYPIGIVNIIGNGEQYMGITTDDNLTTTATFRSGSKKLYGILGLGYNFSEQKNLLAFEYGLGANLVNTKYFRLKAEGAVLHLENFKRGDFVKSSISVLPSVRFGKLELFGGPSLNFVSTNSVDGRKLVDDYLWHDIDHDDDDGDREYGLYLGYKAGLHWRM